MNEGVYEYLTPWEQRYSTHGLTLDERMDLGEAYIEHYYPGGLADINVNQLNMSDCDNCVMGQIAGSFTEWRDGYDDVYYLRMYPALKINDCVLMGFETGANDEYTDLTEAWRNRIMDRRAERKRQKEQSNG